MPRIRNPEPTWECIICGRQYTTRIEAEQCETHGLAPFLPTGLIYGSHNKEESFYHCITQAIAVNNICWHGNYPSTWITRDNGCRDSLWSYMCGGGNSIQLFNYHHLDFNRPSFHRMIVFLEEFGVEPTLWDGEKVVSFYSVIANEDD